MNKYIYIKQKIESIRMIYQIKEYRFLFFAFLFFTCSQPKDKPADTPTSGNITIFSDESFYPIVSAEASAFESQYSNAKINVQYGTDDEAIMALLNDKTDMIFVSRELNQQEKDFISEKKITVRTNKIATDAIVFLVNKDCSDSLITTVQLDKIFKGEIKTWKELSSSLPDLAIEIVVDKSTSGNLNFLMQKLGLNTGSVKIYAAGSNSKVMEYVRSNIVSIGIIGLNWISDEDDPDLQSKLEKIKVLSVGRGEKMDTTHFYKPVQDYLVDEKYPFTRPIYTINNTAKTGLGTGFASYILSDPGQRIMLKAGLLPAKMPGRKINITH